MVAIDAKIGFPALGLVVALFLTLVSQAELIHMIRGKARPVTRLVQLATAAIFVSKAVMSYVYDRPASAELTLAILCGAALLILTQATLRLQFRQGEAASEHALDVGAGLFALAYLALPLSFMADLALRFEGGEGTFFVAILVFISKCGDIGGYLGGSTFGKRRVMPRVSPKKSWEGSATGLVLTIAATFGLHAAFPQYFFGLETLQLVILAVVINLATQMGDFSESMVKRSCGVKDSGAVLPTFGGALDIVDSLVFSIPVAAMIFALAV